MATQELSNPQPEQEPILIALVKHLFKRQISSFFTIFGRRGSGKTDISLLILEILFAEKVMRHFATNIKVESSYFHIEHISNLDDLRTWAYEKKGPKIYVFDEVGKSVRRRSPMTSLNIKVIDEFQVLRKPKLSFLALTIDEKYTDNALLGEDVLDGVWRKPVWNNPRLALYDDFLENLHETFIDIPPTSIAFDTWSTARFTEHGPVVKPKIRDKDESKLWDWSNGATAEDLGLHYMQINRLTRRFIREALKAKYHASQ